MPYCQECGQLLSDDDRFCWKCGTPVASPLPQNARTDGEDAEGAPADKSNAPVLGSKPDGTSEASTPDADVCAEGEIHQTPSSSVKAGTQDPEAFAGGETYQAPSYGFAANQANTAQASSGQNFGYSQQGPSYQQPNGYQQASQHQSKSADHLGPLARAWHDFRDSPDKLLIVTKLALSSFIPGAGALIVDGYIYSWSKESALDRAEPLHGKIVRQGVLDTGLYAWGANLIGGVLLALVCIVLSAFLGAIDMPGWLIAVVEIVLIVLGSLFILVMGLRASICGRVRSGLDLQKASDMLFRNGNVGRFLVADLVPGLLAAVAEVVLTCVLALLLALVLGMGAMAQGSLSGLFDSIFTNLLFWGVGGTNLALMLVLVFLYAFASFFCLSAACLVSARAFGYIVAEFRPWEWPEYQENSGRYAQETL